MTGRRRRRDRAIQIVTLAITAIALALLAHHARSVDWPQVWQALAGYRPHSLAVAAALAALSYLLYCGYELAARRYAGHGLSTRRTMLIGFTCYAFSLNVGALIGGGGFRLRLYSHSGLRAGAIGRIVAFAVSTNWSGYLVLAGSVLIAQPIALPQGAASIAGRMLGLAMLAVAAAYLFACARWHDRAWHLRGHAFKLPSLRMALLQLGLSSANWLTIAALLFVLLQQRIDYPTVLGVLLLAAVAAAVTHIPAGLGALEAIFLALLGERVAQPELLAALLAYRAIYYLAPLLLAAIAYLAFESGAVRRRGPHPDDAG